MPELNPVVKSASEAVEAALGKDAVVGVEKFTNTVKFALKDGSTLKVQLKPPKEGNS